MYMKYFMYMNHFIVDDKAVGQDLANLLESALESAVAAAGFQVERGEGDADLLVRHHEEAFAVVLKVAPRPTQPVIEAVLSKAALIAKKAGKATGARPVAIVGASSISTRMAGAVTAFAREYLDRRVAYGWIDARGGLKLHGSPRLAALSGWEAPASGPLGPEPSKKHSVFSDLGQWILKVLLARKLPPALLTAPRERPKNARQLAELADVSQATVHRILAAGRDEGLITTTRAGISVVDPARLLERWRRNVVETTHEVATNWILRRRDSETAVRKALSKMKPDDAGKPSAALGLFAAADRLDLGFVKGARPHVLVRDLSADVLERLGLRESKAGEDADLFVRRPAYPESTFRGAVLHGRNVWVTDVLQTWLDVSYHPARGEEQAEYIRRRALTPAFAEND